MGACLIPRFCAWTALAVMLMMVCACKKTPEREGRVSEEAVRALVARASETALPTPGVAALTLHVQAGSLTPEERAATLATLARELGGSAVVAPTPTGEFSVLAHLPAQVARDFCARAGANPQLAAALPSGETTHLIEVLVAP